MVENMGSLCSSAREGDVVHVIATSLEGTRAALDLAITRLRGTTSRILLFSIRPGPVSTWRWIPSPATEQTLWRLAKSLAPPPRVFSCVCEHPTDVVQLFTASPLVIVGGTVGRWWPTAEQRLVRNLSDLGCRVTFVSVASRSFVSPFRAGLR
jgi:hypothetical protein